MANKYAITVRCTWCVLCVLCVYECACESVQPYQQHQVKKTARQVRWRCFWPMVESRVRACRFVFTIIIIRICDCNVIAISFCALALFYTGKCYDLFRRFIRNIFIVFRGFNFAAKMCNCFLADREKHYGIKQQMCNYSESECTHVYCKYSAIWVVAESKKAITLCCLICM